MDKVIVRIAFADLLSHRSSQSRQASGKATTSDRRCNCNTETGTNWSSPKDFETVQSHQLNDLFSHARLKQILCSAVVPFISEDPRCSLTNQLLCHSVPPAEKVKRPGLCEEKHIIPEKELVFGKRLKKGHCFS